DHLVGIVTCLSILTQPRMRSRLFTLDHVVGAIRGTGFMEYLAPFAVQSALMPANLTTLPHFSVSSAMSFPKSAGESATTARPRSESRALILGSARPALISLFSFSTISAGVFFGVPTPVQKLDS